MAENHDHRAKLKHIKSNLRLKFVRVMQFEFMTVVFTLDMLQEVVRTALILFEHSRIELICSGWVDRIFCSLRCM